MCRTLSRTGLQQDNRSQDVLDYSKLPRSSGDGMEHNSEGEVLPEQVAKGQILKIKSVITPLQGQDLTQLPSVPRKSGSRPPSTSRILDSHLHNNYTNTGITRRLQPSDQTAKEQDQSVSKTFQISSVYPAAKNSSSIKQSEQIVSNKNNIRISDDNLETGYLSSVTSPKPLSVSAKSVSNSLLMNSENLIPKVGPEANSTVNITRDNLSKEKILERSPECIDSRLIITELEARNSKLVEEKVKLSVQLGVQSKVNSELKTLLVASVGEELENRLENYIQRSAQREVELKHWKNMCEEYQEESERLEIECDVWRTKFLASRMMSDELSCWRSTLYAHYRQSQSALQRLLDERSELQQHLMYTNKQLQFINKALKHVSGCYDSKFLGSKADSVADQSVLELASVNSCVAQAVVDLTLKVFPSVPLSTSDLSTGDSNNTCLSVQHRKVMEHTPAEKMALQVLSREVDLATEESQGEVMRRMGRQYIGHGHKSRLLTNSFRVTYDCCDRCNGKLEVV